MDMSGLSAERRDNLTRAGRKFVKLSEQPIASFEESERVERELEYITRSITRTVGTDQWAITGGGDIIDAGHVAAGQRVFWPFLRY